ncbi:MAG: hypothetical protein HKL80_01570 [Acidimicrobiales bacterium]|nr:hypothetical protein [Acidimicrobiales bacterium]
MEIKRFLKDEMERLSNDITVTPDIHSLIKRSKAKRRSQVLMIVPIVAILVVAGLITSFVTDQGSPSRNTSRLITSTTKGLTTLPNGSSTTPTTTTALQSGTTGTTSGVTSTTSLPGSTTQPSTTTTLDPNPTWKPVFQGSSVGGVPNISLQSVSCATSQVCFAGGFGGQNVSRGQTNSVILVTTNGGISWSLDYTSDNEFIASISCSSTFNCVAGGYHTPSGDGLTLYTSNGGQSWNASSYGGSVNPAIIKVDCPVGSSFCVASGTPNAMQGISGTNELQIFYSLNSGQSFAPASSVPSADNSGVGTDLSCSSSGDCILLGYFPTPGTISPHPIFAVISNDQGSMWDEMGLSELPGGQSTIFGGISCYAGSNCTMVGASSKNGTAYMANTSDTGKSWTVYNDSSVSDLQEFSSSGNLSCIRQVCFYASSSSFNQNIIEISMSQWSANVVYTISGQQFQDISCTTSSNCLAISNASSSVTYSGVYAFS